MKNLLLISFSMLLTFVTSHAQLTVPTTPQPRNAMIECYTGIHCTYGPDASKRADDIRALDPDVTYVEFHEGFYAAPNPGEADLRTNAGGSRHALVSIMGYPAGPVNRTMFPAESYLAVSRGTWQTYINTVQSVTSPVNMAVDGFYDAGAGKLHVTVAMYYTSTVSIPHYLHVYLLQDNIITAQQGGSTFYPARVLPSGDFIQNDIFRDAITGLSGDLISGTTTGNRIDRSFIYTPATINGIPFDASKAKVVAFISTSGNMSEVITATHDYDAITGSPSSGTGAYSISGTTMMGGDTTITDMRRVYLIQQDTNYTTPYLVATDSVTTQGSYSFIGLSPGTYYLKVALLPGTPNYSSYIPSYHWQQTLWSNADAITVTTSSVVGKFIDLIPGVNPGGPGFIGGLVSAGAGILPGDPMPGVTVLLYDTLDNAIGYSITDKDGKYEFSNLAYGTYEVFLDIINKKSFARRVEISPTDPAKGNNNFSVNGKDITFTGIEEELAQDGFKVYPNPSKGQLFVNWNAVKSGSASLRVMNILGETVYRESIRLTTGQNTVRLDELNIGSGVYFVEVNDGSNQFSRKVVFN